MLLSAAGENKYRDLQPDNMQRMRNLGKRLHQIPFLRTQGTLHKRKQKEWKSHKEWRAQMNQGRSFIAVHMNSWRLRQHAQRLQGSGPYGVLEMKGGVDILPSLNQKPSPVKSHLQIKLKIFFTGETNHS